MHFINKTKISFILLSTIVFSLSSNATESDHTSSVTQGIRIIQSEPGKYPQNLILMGIMSGWCKVNVAVNERGKLTDSIITGYSHPDFAAATLEALNKWEFEAEQINGKAIASVTQVNFNYNHESSAAKIVSTNVMEYSEQQEVYAIKEVNKFYPLYEIDQIPVPIHLVAPSYSDEDTRRNDGKKVTVKFYIDETGSVRLPMIVESDNDEIARNALAAVAQWRFEPPTYQGKPVITRASQVFVFKSKNKQQVPTEQSE